MIEMPYVPPVLAFWSALIALVVKLIVVAAVSYGLSLLLAKDMGRRGAGASEFELPTSMVGRAVPHLRGKRKVKGINVLTPVFAYSSRKKKKSGNTVAYYYFFSVWVGVCISADGIKQLCAGGRTLWPTLNDPDTEAADGLTEGTVRAVNAFGGYRREGGQNGDMVFLNGDSSQTLGTYLTKYFGDVPPGRGIFSVLFYTIGPEDLRDQGRAYYWGTTTYPKWPEFLVKSTDKTVTYDALWLAAYSNVGDDDDFNPIHAIREWLTDPLVGRGKSTDLIGTSFAITAVTCHDEEYGISFVLDSTPDKLQDYIDMVSEVIDGNLYFDQTTGKYEINLARDDYDPDALDEYGTDDFWVKKFRRPSPGKTPSHVVVKFSDRHTGDVGVGDDDDIALLEMQDSHPITQEYDYRAYVCSQTLADKIAAREQKQFSAMGAIIELRCLRTMSDIQQGDVFKISYPALNIVTMIVRVAVIDRGDLKNDEITMKVVEDIFGTAYSVYGSPGTPASGPSEIFVETDNTAQFSTIPSTEVGPY